MLQKQDKQAEQDCQSNPSKYVAANSENLFTQICHHGGA
jgi:hypothetical protein